jgi:hypothetical protein
MLKFEFINICIIINNYLVIISIDHFVGKEIFGEKIPLEMFAGGEGIKLQATISSASSKSISQKQAKSELSDSLSLAELDMASSCSGSGYFSDFNSQSSQSSAQVSPTCNHPDFREFMAQTALSSINPNNQGRELAPLARSLREEPPQQGSQPSKLAKTSRKTSFGTRASSDGTIFHVICIAKF